MIDMNFNDIDILKLATDIRDACKEALVKAEASTDGGSCNHDFVVLRFNRKGSERRTTAFREKLAGFRANASWSEGRYTRGQLSLSLPSVGQGAQNTIYVEHVSTFLQNRGWPAAVHYLTD